MSDNTLQFKWIVTIKEGLDNVFRDDPNVFVAGDLLWYPVEGDPKTRTAPDTMVAFGRPKGYRGSYKQWVEGGIAPQVVFEVLSPGNRPPDLAKKFAFYDRFGVEEYYVYDPDDGRPLGLAAAGRSTGSDPRDERPRQPAAGCPIRAGRRAGQPDDHRTGWTAAPHLWRGRRATRRRPPPGRGARSGRAPIRPRRLATRPRRPSGVRPWKRNVPSVSPRGSASLASNRIRTEIGSQDGRQGGFSGRRASNRATWASM